MDEITLFLTILITGLSLLMFIVSLISTCRVRNFKFLIIGFAFIGFIIKGLLLLFEYISQDEIALIIDFTVIILLYFAIIKK